MKIYEPVVKLLAYVFEKEIKKDLELPEALMSS